MARGYAVACKIIFAFIIAFTVLLVSYFERTYTVTFDTKGGTLYKATEIKANGTVIKPVDPVMEGYIFEGWYLNDTNEIYDFTSKVERNITLTAKWKSIV